MDNMTPQMKTFVESSVNDDFGLTIDQIASQCRTYGRFDRWLNGDITKIKQVLTIVKSNGVSPAFFASYEKTEGYNGKWGWLNHTHVNGSPTQDAGSVSRWVKSQSNSTAHNPAWIDYANYNDFVPSSVKSFGNNHFKSLAKGTIGRVVIAGTAAATWEVYYPLGLQKSYNGVQNYGAPIQGMINTILSWGGVIDGSGSGSSFVGNIVDYLLNSTTGLSMTSRYGWRIHPISGDRSFHTGDDIAKSGSPSPETPVPARAEIIHAGPSGTGLGNWVVFRLLGSSYMVGIGHFATVHVSKGQIIEAGTSVGIMGATGNVTGRHWHIEVRDYTNGNYFGSPHHDPKSITFNIEGAGSSPDGPTKKDDLIVLFLCNALRNWG